MKKSKVAPIENGIVVVVGKVVSVVGGVVVGMGGAVTVVGWDSRSGPFASR